jgi:hypothetical protein
MSIVCMIRKQEKSTSSMFFLFKEKLTHLIRLRLGLRPTDERSFCEALDDMTNCV